MSDNLPVLRITQILVDVTQQKLVLLLDPREKYPTLTRDNLELGAKRGDFVVAIDGINIIGKAISEINKILFKTRNEGDLLRVIVIPRECMNHPGLSYLGQVYLIIHSSIE